MAGVVFISSAVSLHAEAITASTTTTDTSLSTQNRDHLLAQGNEDALDGNFDKALGEVSEALQIDDHLAQGYELRGSIYVSLKLWDKAERDYKAADKLSPDPAYKYKLAEIKYLQKKYDDARPIYAALESDGRLGDLARYRVYLCDLFGAHPSIAAADLADIDKNPKNPSHFYAHAVEDLFQGDRPSANQLVASAEEYFGKSVENAYLAAITQAQNFIPELATFTTKDGTSYKQARVLLDNAGFHVQSGKGWINVPLDQLPDDLSSFPPDIREEIDRRKTMASSTPAIQHPVTFTTKSGHSYANVRWMVADSGLSVLTDNGWTTIPFSDLPADTSSFPKDLLNALQQKPAVGVVNAKAITVSFTTKDGRHFDNVHAQPTDDGLDLVTSDGPTFISARDLPADLSVFPAEWRNRLRAAAAITEPPSESTFVTFTGKNGKHYDDVRASMEEDGLRVTTELGLVNVPWTQLPDDLSAFPPEWRDKIAAAKRIATNTSKSTTSISP